MKHHGPFVYGSLAENEHFTNRTKETDELITNLTNGIHTFLISPRRWGKSSLVKAVARKMTRQNKNVRFCFVDLFNTRNEYEFYKLLAEQVVKSVETNMEGRLSVIKNYFRGLIPAISFSPDTLQEFSLSFSVKELEKSPDEILQLAEVVAKQRKLHLVVCIDEFQNIGHFENALAFQKKLRSHWQSHHHVTYCLYGSKKHMLLEIFGSVKMPFYRFGNFMFLEKIATEHWVKYITERFEKTGKRIAPALAEQIALTVENHPYYVQQYAQTVWDICGKTAHEAHLTLALNRILTTMNILFMRETEWLSNSQINFLKAVCSGAENISSQKVIQEFNLGSSANVVKIKKALIDKEVIDIFNGKPDFLDPMYKKWFWQVYMQKKNFM
ncbi:MAG: ATP-binding protein [Chitinophagales bacterium]|nr:ATP-binding protein [Chitinophagales bacterium]MDW8419200.1 ATP-binding protein [Chitinophagales bacterium]